MLFSHLANVAQIPLQIPLGWVMVPTWLRHSLRKGGTFAFAPSGDFGSLACRLVWQLHQSYNSEKRKVERKTERKKERKMVGQKHCKQSKWENR